MTVTQREIAHSETSPKRLNDLQPGVDYLVPKYYLPVGVADDLQRLDFLKACERLGVPKDEWPDWGPIQLPGWPESLPGAPPSAQKTMGYAVQPIMFQLAPFDLCDDDHRSWKLKANRAWRHAREDYLKKSTKTGILLNKIGILSRRSRTRSTGAKRNIIPSDQRYELAVRYYCQGETWGTLKQINGGRYTIDQIRKSVMKILSDLGLKTGCKRPKHA